MMCFLILKVMPKSRSYVKQHPLQYSIANNDATKTQLKLNKIKLRKGKEKLEVFYKTGWMKL